MKCLVFLSAFTFVGCTDPPPKFIPPAESEVISMTGVYPDDSKSGLPYVSVELPRSEWADILSLLSTGEESSTPMKWMVLGDVEIATDEGTLRVDIYQTGDERGAFKAEGTYYRGGSDSAFIHVLSRGRPTGANKAE